MQYVDALHVGLDLLIGGNTSDPFHGAGAFVVGCGGHGDIAAGYRQQPRQRAGSALDVLVGLQRVCHAQFPGGGQGV